MIADAQLVHRIYSAACDERPWADLFADLAKGFDAQSAHVFTPLLQASSRDHFWIQVGLDEARVQDYLRECQEVDLWYLALVRRHGVLGTGLTYTTLGLVGEQALKRSRYFADYLRPMEIGHALGSVISSGGDGDGLPLMSMNIYRPFGRAPFTPHEVSRFAQYQTHLRRAMIVRTRLHAAGVASMAVEQTATPLVVLARDRRVLLANPAAEKLLTADSGRLVRRGFLQAASSQATATLEAALAACHRREFSSMTGSVVRLAGPVGRGVVVRLVPPPAGVPKGHLAAAVGMLSREGGLPVQPAAVVAALYRLTPSEAQLVQSLCDGLTPQEHCREKDVTMATVKTQLQSVFGKTGVRRQAELVRLAGTLSK